MKKADFIVVFFMSAAAILFLTGIGRGQEEAADAGQGKAWAVPVLSAESGFYDEPFLLEINAPEGARIYYTLDGKQPAADSELYTGPIEITDKGSSETEETYVRNMRLNWLEGEGESHPNSATVLRAVAVYEDGQVSDTVTATYFIGKDFYRDKLIVSLVADPEDLFGENGIYVTGKVYDDWYLGDRSGEAPTANFLKRGEEWERPAVLEMFQGSSFLKQPVGIRIQGASARDYDNKRFSVYARKKYGSSWFDAPIFGEDRCHSFVLRSGFMNGYIQHLVQDRDVASAESRECLVYLNGAEWYTTIAQEKYSRKYFQEKYGVDDDNVIIVKGGVLADGEAEDIKLYQAVYDFLDSHDMSEAASYQKLDELMDIQSYIDFSCVNVYFANLDYNENKNCICWRSRKIGREKYEDGRWRWALYDMDLENLDYGVYMEEINTFTMDTHYAGSAFNTRPMYVALRQNPLFCRQFVLSFMDMVNTDFTVQRAAEAMEDWEVTMEWWGMQPGWVENFFPARTEFVTGYLAEEFELTGTKEVLSLSVNDPEAGKIVLNTIEPDLSRGEWSGSYFTDYPVTVTALANQGYHFEEWRSGSDKEDAEKEAMLTIEIPAGGLALQAVFEKNKR